MTSVMWFRRDLRLADNPALLSAAPDPTDARAVPLNPISSRDGVPTTARTFHLADNRDKPMQRLHSRMTP